MVLSGVPKREPNDINSTVCTGVYGFSIWFVIIIVLLAYSDLILLCLWVTLVASRMWSSPLLFLRSCLVDLGSIDWKKERRCYNLFGKGLSTFNQRATYAYRYGVQTSVFSKERIDFPEEIQTNNYQDWEWREDAMIKRGFLADLRTPIGIQPPSHLPKIADGVLTNQIPW